MPAIVSRIRSLCAKKNITIAQLERETGIGNGVIARWENGSPKVDNLMKVADYFKVTLNYFVKDISTKE